MSGEMAAPVVVEKAVNPALMLLAKTDSTDSSVSDKNGPSFIRLGECIEEGDTVLVYVSFGAYYPVVVKRGMSCNMKYGQLKHEYLIGKKWGSRISASAGYIYALRPSADLWTRSLPKRTQILYTADVSLIVSLLDARPGSVVCESGTGSGSLSHSLALAILPDGHLYTHDIDDSRTRKVEQEFKEHGLSSVTTAVVQNVCVDGFFVVNACDGVFLDVPSPWEAVPAAAVALSRPRGGRLVSFSPCIEQVQRTVQAMKKEGFVMIETIEVVPRSLMVVEERRQSLASFETHGEGEECAPGRARKRKADCRDPLAEGESSYAAIPAPATQPTHTGYLTSGTMLPRI